MTGPFYMNLAFWSYLIAGLPFGLFVGFYAVRSPAWKTTPIGRALMALAISLTSMFVFILVVLSVPLSREIIGSLRALLLGGITIAGWLMFKSLLHQQSVARRLKEETQDDRP